MDKLLPQLMAFPPDFMVLSDSQYESQIKSLVQTLNKTPASVLMESTRDGLDPLNVLDPSRNTLPYMYTLLAHARSSPEHQAKAPNARSIPTLDPRGDLWARVVDFLDRFDSRQVRYAGMEFRRLVEIVLKTAKSLRKPILAVQPVRNAILRLDPTSSTLTSTHVFFVRLCLEARTFRAALPILDRDILEFPLTAQTLNSLMPINKQARFTYITAGSGLSAKLTYADHLHYHLYGAMIYMGLKKWERAMEFLEFVITAPTATVASNIMAEAYKKWLLVGLIHLGRRPKMPRPIAASTEKAFRAIAKPYDHIVDVFQSGDGEQLHREFEAGRAVWKSDNNTGLLYQALEAFQLFAIRNLGTIYSTISMGEICRRFTVNQQAPDPFTMEQTIFKLISLNLLNGTLSHPSPSSPERTILTFSPSVSLTPSVTSASTEQSYDTTLQKHLHRLETLNSYIKQLDRKMGLSKDYIQWKLKATKDAGSNATGNSTEGAGVDAGLAMGWPSDDAIDTAMSGASIDPNLFSTHDQGDAGVMDEDVMSDL